MPGSPTWGRPAVVRGQETRGELMGWQGLSDSGTLWDPSQGRVRGAPKDSVSALGADCPGRPRKSGRDTCLPLSVVDSRT